MSTKPRLGVYICHCGINIAGTVDVQAVADFAAGLPGVCAARHYPYLCSEPGQALIQEDITSLDLNRIVVASCSPAMHEVTFRAALAEVGLNPYCLDMANIREQCAWVHPPGVQTTHKAMQLVASAVAKAARLEPLFTRHVPVLPGVLVIGGGVAGLQAALDVADAGFQATLVECLPELGGNVAKLCRTFPSLEPASGLIGGLIERARHHPRITLLTQAEVHEVSGYVGNFQIRVGHADAMVELHVGAIIVATGFDLFDAHRKPELGYGIYPEVITTLDFEQMAAAGEILVNGRTPKKVAFIQCVGSRDPSCGNPSCSRVCCMVTAKQALSVCEKLPETDVTVFYMDVRAFGKGFEELYDRARQAGVVYRRGNPSEILRRGERVVVRVEDTLLNEQVEVEADLVVLAAGMVPRRDTLQVARLLKLSRSADGFFMEAHPKLRPVDTAMAGIFLAGCCQGPKDITDTISQARAAASAALILLLRREVQVAAQTAYVDEELCSGCGQCAQVCSFAALAIHPWRGVMTVNSVLCQGCGACVTACPSKAINLHQFTFPQVMAQVDTLSSSDFLLPQ